MVIATGARVKRPGESMRGDDVELVARHQPSRGAPPYERLLGDALRGDSSLFTRDEAVEAAWRVVDPILDLPGPVDIYEPGTWGPAAAAACRGGRRWLARPANRGQSAVLSATGDSVVYPVRRRQHPARQRSILERPRHAADAGAGRGRALRYRALYERTARVARLRRLPGAVAAHCVDDFVADPDLLRLSDLPAGLPIRRPHLSRCARASAVASGDRPYGDPVRRRYRVPAAEDPALRTVGRRRRAGCTCISTRNTCSTAVQEAYPGAALRHGRRQAAACWPPSSSSGRSGDHGVRRARDITRSKPAWPPRRRRRTSRSSTSENLRGHATATHAAGDPRARRHR